MITVEKEALLPNSLGIPSRAAFVINIHTKEDIKEAVEFAKKEKLPLLTLGEGTNILARSFVNAVVIILEFKGIKINGDRAQIEAGKNWDNAVEFAVENGLSGIEALSAIPGKTGSAPIQNIGAYGAEISNCLEKVEVFDTEKGEFRELSKQDCQFGYRDSIFKKHPNKFIVTSILLKLSKTNPQIPKYKDVENYFAGRNMQNPTLKEIRESIIEIRSKKLPDPKVVPNVGSYFTNPIIEVEKSEDLKNKFPEIPLFPFGDKVKVSAGWLIEHAGLKGAKVGEVEMSKDHALVLTNPARASFEAIERAEKFIVEEVRKKFGVILRREPVVIG